MDNRSDKPTKKKSRATKKSMKEASKSAPKKMDTIKVSKIESDDKMTVTKNGAKLNTQGLPIKSIAGWVGTDPVMKSRAIPGKNQDNYNKSRAKSFEKAANSRDMDAMKSIYKSGTGFVKYLK